MTLKKYKKKLSKINDKLKKQKRITDKHQVKLTKIKEKFDEIYSPFLEAEVTTKPIDTSNLKKGDKIKFVSLTGGYYGSYKGTVEDFPGYCEVKDIELIYHKNNSTTPSHRVSFNDIYHIY